MSNVPDYRSPEQAHYETVRDLRTALEQAERERDEVYTDLNDRIAELISQRDEARGLLREWKKADEAGQQGLLDFREYDRLADKRDAHLRDTGD